MSLFALAIIVLIIGAVWFYLGRRTVLLSKSREATKLHSLPHYYGLFVALTAILPAYALLVVMAIGDDIVFSKTLFPMKMRCCMPVWLTYYTDSKPDRKNFS